MGDVRIIGGQWRRSKLPVPQQEGLRPTPDRVRETLFNWLGQDLTGWHCLDAFAGSGALGFEAASRGAAQVQLIEQDANTVRTLQNNAQRLQAHNITVRRGDGLATLRSQPTDTLDLIFIDPPFASQLHASALQAAQGKLKKTGFLYLESPHAWAEPDLLALGYQLHRQLKAGQVWAYLLTPAG